MFRFGISPKVIKVSLFSLNIVDWPLVVPFAVHSSPETFLCFKRRPSYFNIGGLMGGWAVGGPFHCAL